MRAVTIYSVGVVGSIRSMRRGSFYLSAARDGPAVGFAVLADQARHILKRDDEVWAEPKGPFPRVVGLSKRHSTCSSFAVHSELHLARAKE